jgi:hypothetical protein
VRATPSRGPTPRGDLKGWDEGASVEALLRNGSLLREFEIRRPVRYGVSGKRMLFDITRKVLGHDTPNYPQQIGDCVSFGGKNATEYVQATDILGGKREVWKAVFPPYYYGCARVLVAGWHSYQDGSSGSDLAAAVVRYGALFSDVAGVPQYSGRVAKAWGHDGPPDNFLTLGKEHLVKSVVRIRSYDDFIQALDNGYPCTTASNVGYEMQAGSDGFHRRGPSWSHQMCFIGYGLKPEPYALIVNNWGDVHGTLTDFDDPNVRLPAGVLRVRQRDAEAHINAGETFAWSQFDGLLGQDIDKALFKFLGN